ncbi:MAG: NAD(P)H-dependent oxidoreductase [Hydrogenophaga sp.]|nr:NAD(P)H-dependent oxidoreductase [Hydrogenophaga sp.]
MPNTLVVHAHPRASASLVTQALRRTFDSQPDTTVRALYDLYPDFDIDIVAERAALQAADLVVWLSPVYWYSVPSLMKHWFEQVLAYGWAYGPGGDALRGKTAWWVTSAGGQLGDYTPGGSHGRPFTDFVPPVEHTARFCGMHWLEPFVVHGGHANSHAEVSAHCGALLQRYAQALAGLPGGQGGAA